MAPLFPALNERKTDVLMEPTYYVLSFDCHRMSADSSSKSIVQKLVDLKFAYRSLECPLLSTTITVIQF